MKNAGRSIALLLLIALFGALGFISLAEAAKLPDFSQAGANVTGNSARIGMTGNGTNWGSTIPISPTAGGWTYAGNYGIPQAGKGTTMNMGHSGDVFFSGSKYPFQAAYTVPAANIWQGVLTAAALLKPGPWGLALLVGNTAAPYVKQWFEESGFRVDPLDPSKVQRVDTSLYCPSSPCYEYKVTPRAFAMMKSPEVACRDYVAGWLQTQWPDNGYVYAGSSETTCYYSGNPGISSGSVPIFFRDRAPDVIGVWIDMNNMSDIAPYMQAKPFDPRVVPEILAQGGDIPMPAPTITGPASLPGQTVTTRNADGSVSTQTVTNNYQINGDTITNITNVTSNTTYNSSTNVTTTSSTVITPSQNPTTNQPGICETNPNSVACASKQYLDDILTKLGEIKNKPDAPTDCDKKPNSIGCSEYGTPTPDTPVPKETVNVTITPKVFAGGACPGPVQFGAFGQSYYFTYDTLCGKLSSLSALFLALAGLAAAWIFTSGFKV